MEREKLRFGRCRGLVLLTEEEALRLAEAVNKSHVPRSLLILEAIQAGLQTFKPATIPGRRSKAVCFRLPAEITERVKQAAQVHGVSQQSLIRHLLFTYLSKYYRNRPTRRKPIRPNRRMWADP